MINLLPQDSARQLRAARHNSILIRYVIGSAIALGLIVVVHVFAFALFKATEASNTSFSETNQKKIDDYKEVADTAKAYQDNIKRASTIFSSQLSYTIALENIAKSLPSGAVISSIALSPEGTGQPITLTVEAKTQEIALQVKEQLESNKVAHNISISSLSQGSTGGEGGGAPSEYPFSINLNLTLLDSIFTQEGRDE